MPAVFVFTVADMPTFVLLEALIAVVDVFFTGVFEAADPTVTSMRGSVPSGWGGSSAALVFVVSSRGVSDCVID